GVLLRAGPGGLALPGPFLAGIAGTDGAAGDGDGAEQCDGAEEPPPGGELSSGGGAHGVLLRPGRPCAARPSQPAWSMSPHRRTAVVVRGCDVAILRPRGSGAERGSPPAPPMTKAPVRW